MSGVIYVVVVVEAVVEMVSHQNPRHLQQLLMQMVLMIMVDHQNHRHFHQLLMDNVVDQESWKEHQLVV